MVESKKELVLDLLGRHKYGLTIIEMSKELNISRNTVPVILAELYGEKKINYRRIGKAKLYYLLI